MNRMKLTTCSGLPVKFLRSCGSCVATPTGQVFRWHTRIMMQPSATSGAVAKPNSSAPSKAAMTTSRPVFKLPVGFHHDPAAQVVQQQRLMGFRQAQFPGNTGMFDARQRRSAGPAVITADQDHIGMRLGDSGGNGAHAHFGHQLDADPGVVVGVLQIVNQLRQILDGVNVMMRRRRNQAHARRANAASWQSTDRPCSPGSCPPSPGLAPCAILICNSWALTR